LSQPHPKKYTKIGVFDVILRDIDVIT